MNIRLNKSQFGNEWPFTTDHVLLQISFRKRCPSALFVIMAGLKRYALNGIAENYGYREISPIVIKGKSLSPILYFAVDKLKNP